MSRKSNDGAIIILLIGAIIGVVWAIISGIFSMFAGAKQERAKKEERSKKYGDRVIDTTKTLFERNSDIISKFKKKIKATTLSYSRYDRYYLDNITRDCLNEIAEAEDAYDFAPGSSYLSYWQPGASEDWGDLADNIKDIFTERRKLIDKRAKEKELEAIRIVEKQNKERAVKEKRARDIKNLVEKKRKELDVFIEKQNKELELPRVERRKASKRLLLDNVQSILTVNKTPWSSTEKSILTRIDSYTKFESINTYSEQTSVHSLNQRIAAVNISMLDKYNTQRTKVMKFKTIIENYKKRNVKAIQDRLGFILNDINLPYSIPKYWDINYDKEQSIAIVEIQLPDVVHNKIYKIVKLKKGDVEKELNKTETREEVPKIHPAIMLRTAYEIYRNDFSNTIDLLVINGWVEYDDPTTGKLTKTYTTSLMVKRESILELNLDKLNPLLAFASLEGKSAGKLIDIIPITPSISLDRDDSRIVETKEVIDGLDASTNLASMDWQDFENLIAELFQKEFADIGAEVKVTQASRDRGVDALVYNPDPIKGGVYVIQAKRYANTVDVSAVRDLVAVVSKEGASRGILVTTSNFGADAYEFAKGYPITLLSGAELLGLLRKHNYTFKIDLPEARKLNKERNESNNRS